MKNYKNGKTRYVVKIKQKLCRYINIKFKKIRKRFESLPSKLSGKRGGLQFDMIPIARYR